MLDNPVMPYVTFAVHNVVSDPNGTLFEVTPGQLKPFLTHIGSDEEHDRLLFGPQSVIASRSSEFEEAKRAYLVGFQIQHWFNVGQRLQREFRRDAPGPQARPRTPPDRPA